MNTVDTTTETGQPESEATPLSEHRLDRGSFVIAVDVEITTSPNGSPGRLILLTRGQVIHLITFAEKEGFFLRKGGDNFFVPFDAAERILVREK